ncbi:hypothetical protein ACOME3_001814 [Neoechinorhynchus agilis]
MDEFGISSRRSSPSDQENYVVVTSKDKSGNHVKGHEAKRTNTKNRELQIVNKINRSESVNTFKDTVDLQERLQKLMIGIQQTSRSAAAPPSPSPPRGPKYKPSDFARPLMEGGIDPGLCGNILFIGEFFSQYEKALFNYWKNAAPTYYNGDGPKIKSVQSANLLKLVGRLNLGTNDRQNDLNVFVKIINTLSSALISNAHLTLLPFSTSLPSIQTNIYCALEIIRLLRSHPRSLQSIETLNVIDCISASNEPAYFKIICSRSFANVSVEIIVAVIVDVCNLILSSEMISNWMTSKVDSLRKNVASLQDLRKQFKNYIAEKRKVAKIVNEIRKETDGMRTTCMERQTALSHKSSNLSNMSIEELETRLGHESDFFNPCNMIFLNIDDTMCREIRIEPIYSNDECCIWQFSGLQGVVIEERLNMKTTGLYVMDDTTRMDEFFTTHPFECPAWLPIVRKSLQKSIECTQVEPLLGIIGEVFVSDWRDAIRDYLNGFVNRLYDGTLAEIKNRIGFMRDLENTFTEEAFRHCCYLAYSFVLTKFTLPKSVYSLPNEFNELLTFADCPSKLAMVIALMDAGVDWSKSSAGLSCQICNNDKPELGLILCDLCNRPFHAQCVSFLDSDKFECPKCRPMNNQDPIPRKRTATVGCTTRHKTVKKICAVCQEDATDAIQCNGCEKLYHFTCHNPAVRRGCVAKLWRCSGCRVARHARSSPDYDSNSNSPS